MNKREKNCTLYPQQRGYEPKEAIPVGGVVLCPTKVEYNAGREVKRLMIRNTGDRPIQVGSHFHLFEVNRYLDFDREAALGFHLNIPATTAIRFEPGDSRQVEIVAYGGKRRIIGFNSLVEGYTGREDGPVYYPALTRAVRRMRHRGFKHCPPQEESKRDTTTTNHSKETKRD